MDGRAGVRSNDETMRQGRLREAIEQFRSGVVTDREELGEGHSVALKLWSIAIIFEELGQIDSAITVMREARDCLDANAPNSAIITVVKGFLVRFHAQNGDDETADSLMNSLTEDFVRSDSINGNQYWAMRASLAFEQEDYQSAEQFFERSMSLGTTFPTLVGAARTYHAQGRLADAVAMFEKAERWHDNVRQSLGVMSVKVHYWLAQVYEESGWSDKAIEQYEEFLDRWKDADPGIPEIADTKERLARLKGQSG